jgi:hypothetical protein
MMGVAWVSYGIPSFGMLIDQGNRSDLIAVKKVTTKILFLGRLIPDLTQAQGRLIRSSYVAGHPISGRNWEFLFHGELARILFSGDNISS